MTIARIFTLGIVSAIGLAIRCGVNREWEGLIASLLAIWNAWAARFILTSWKSVSSFSSSIKK